MDASMDASGRGFCWRAWAGHGIREKERPRECREREERRDRRCYSAHTWLAASVSVTKKAVKLA